MMRIILVQDYYMWMIAYKQLNEHMEKAHHLVWLLEKAYSMTLALLPVGACSEAWWGDGTNYRISLNYIHIAS